MPSEKPKPGRAFPANTVNVIRTGQQVHATLGQMADQKANMLLAATFLVFTIAIGQVRQMSEPLPLLLLAGGAFFSAICAVLAVMPAAHFRTGGKINLMFFGSFTQLREEEFLDRMMDELEHEEAQFRMMARDLYQNGVVLERKKYRLLAYAYRLFLAGLIAAGVAFVVTYFT